MDNKQVLPGDFLVNEEEFEAGRNAFEEDGKVYAAVAGTPDFNTHRRTVNVTNPHRQFQSIQRDSIIIGRVALVKDKVLGLEVLSAERNGVEQILRDYFVTLPVRSMSRDYVEHPRDLYRKGDLVRCKVDRVTPYSVDVRTNEADLGVILAYSSETRAPLRLYGNTLKCEISGKTEVRKVSREYILK